MRKKSFRQFVNEPHGGSIRTDDFSLGAADAYELYSYVWDVLSFRKGGIWRKKMPPQTHVEMAADWAEANPQFRYRSGQFFHPDIIRKLGFIVDKDGYVHLHTVAGHVGIAPGTGKKDATATQGSSTQNYFVVVFVKKTEQFEKAAAELMSTANQLCELYDEGDSGVFRFGFETQSEAEALHLKLAHFPEKYGSILLLQNPLA